MSAKTVAHLSPDRIAGKRIFVRVDFNVPFDAAGRVSDDTRIVEALPTLRHLLQAGGRLVVASHLGRPKGGPDPAFSLRPVADHLVGILGFPVRFVPDLVGPEARQAAADLKDSELLLLENTRFHPGETKNDPELSRALAELADLYVNDAFGSAHRAHATTAGIADAIRARGGEAVAGFLMEKELRYLGMALGEPERPFVAILGGAKISGKIDVIQALLPRVDRLLVGGAMANTFFRALGLETGDSLVEEDRLQLAREALRQGGERLLLPVDCVVAPTLAEDVETRVVDRSSVTAGDRIGDIGPRSRELFAQELAGARTVVWNGPMGVFEARPFSAGTLAVARAVAEATGRGGITVVGGGDSVAAAEQAGVTERLSHVSTGGGASLEFLAGAVLPGVAALDPAPGGAW
jgi:phosphoglycerate kinase